MPKREEPICGVRSKDNGQGGEGIVCGKVSWTMACSIFALGGAYSAVFIL